jgi:hypothetical protein
MQPQVTVDITFGEGSFMARRSMMTSLRHWREDVPEIVSKFMTAGLLT